MLEDGHRRSLDRVSQRRTDHDHAAGSETELDWLRAIARQDRTAFEQLYRSYHGLLSRFLARFTARRDLIEEMVNETLWVVWRTAGSFRGESKVRTWIIGIAYRCLMKQLRDHPAEPTYGAGDRDQEALHEVAPDESEARQAELRDWLRHGMALLPDEQRMTIELAYYLGQSCEEIAAIMNCAVGTVKARMFHARLRLRNTLPALGGDAVPQSHSAQA
jgi:RNA polymerase sigma-70 factor (ECF subfamily)